jgi:hypothetical protein
MNIEEWRQIENYENYEISNLGNVRNIKSKKLIKGLTGHSNYLHVNLYKNDIMKSIKIHKLVI